MIINKLDILQASLLAQLISLRARLEAVDKYSMNQDMIIEGSLLRAQIISIMDEIEETDKQLGKN